MARIGVIILAAGESSRFGKPKQLAIFRGKTLIRRAVDAALGSVCGPVVVVLGADADEIEKHVPQSVTIVRNADWATGMASSIRAGVAAVESEVGAVILMLCDQPLVDSHVLVRLAAGSKAGLVAATYNNTIGVPALFGREFFGELKTLEGEQGAKRILIANSARVDRLNCPEAAMDIDTAEDLNEIHGRKRERRVD